MSENRLRRKIGTATLWLTGAMSVILILTIVYPIGITMPTDRPNVSDGLYFGFGDIYVGHTEPDAWNPEKPTTPWARDFVVFFDNQSLPGSKGDRVAVRSTGIRGGAIVLPLALLSAWLLLSNPRVRPTQPTM